MTTWTSLILFLFIFQQSLAVEALADIFNQEDLKTHLRWNLAVPRDQVTIVKDSNTVRIETQVLPVFDSMAAEISKASLNTNYITDISYAKDQFPSVPATITVKLNSTAVELFSFFRDADKKYILDFWINSDLLPEKVVVRKEVKLPLKKEKVQIKKSEDSPNLIQDINKESSILPIIKIAPLEARTVNNSEGFRDFRYGANFIWNYRPMIPQLERDINLSSKIPDALYPVKDRENLDDPKEAHMQLTINFYREEKWGLMNKSITLYEKKYGRDSNRVLNEFIKANALLKGNLAKPNKGITQSAITILATIKEMTTDYELKSSILRYLIQYSTDLNDHVKKLEYAKELFVEARANFDQTFVIQSASTVLHALSELKQIEKIEEFLADKKMASLLPAQTAMAYTLFALLSKGDTKEVLSRYMAISKSLTKPVHPAILYNVAESLFQHARYEEANKLYSEFLDNYSYLFQAPSVRLRIALCSELLEDDSKKTLTLYKNAIDRSTDPTIRFEAKLRYVGMKIARKINPSKDDQETEVFLEQSPDESKTLTADLKKLLWLVRLRVFISTEKFDKALSYLATLPLDGVKSSERRVFEGDGAEIVYGIIKHSHSKEDYASVTKLWEVYRSKYESRVARNIYLNFIVCDSYIKLGLYKSYERALKDFKRVQKEEPRLYPLWVDRTTGQTLADLIEELELLKLIAQKDWPRASDKLASYPVSLRDSLNYSFYRGVVSFNQKNYPESVAEFEKVLINQGQMRRLTPKQNADLLMAYIDSLYQLNDQVRFKTVVRALSKDINKSQSAQVLKVAERVNYLLLETLAGDQKPDWKEIEILSFDYRQKFQKSPYTSRIGYLYGLSLIKNSRLAEGKEVLQLLTKDNSTPLHIKEMCRSELATLELLDKKL
jgi:tetratricopeptide (TPR) repeat protein